MNNPVLTPLADRLRPRNFEEFFGQEEIVGPGKLLRKLVDNDELSSIIFWGPPGVGKTTLAHIIALKTGARFTMISAVMSGKEELKKVVAEAEESLLVIRDPEGSSDPRRGEGRPRERGREGLAPPPFPRGAAGGLPSSEEGEPPPNPSLERRGGYRRTILFVDEIHRWNKAQQDALLPYVEKGILILIGATTENPSFEIIGALLSRSRVFILKHLSKFDIIKIIQRAIQDEERGLGKIEIKIETETIELLAELSGGDARAALNGLEIAVKAKLPHPRPLLIKERENDASSPYQGEERGEVIITNDDIKEALQRTHLIFDKLGEEFYNLISALHKSMRGGDANAALYWLARMLEGGADPLYVARRVLRFASEDIGMANSEALIQANAAYDACHKIGMPECTVHLAQAVVYCTKSGKSNLLYTAYNQAAKDAKNTSHLGVPLHLRNAPTDFMKEIGYGKDYKYNPDYDGPVEQEYLPEELRGRSYLSK